MDRKKLEAFFANVGDDKKAFALDTLDEYLYFQEQIKKLRQYPLIRVSEKNPAMQQVTPAGKLIKEYSQIMDAKRGTLLRILYRVESSAADALKEMLSEFK